jgi:hypothetical protein
VNQLEEFLVKNSNNVVYDLSLSLFILHTQILIHTQWLAEDWFMVLELQDFYNFLLDSDNDPLEGNRESKGVEEMDKYSQYLCTKKHSPTSEYNLTSLMNGPIRKKLKIIPKNVT